MKGRERRRVAEAAAARHGGVISRDRLRDLGILPVDIRAEVRAERWRVHGTQTVAVHRRPLTDEEQWWSAVWETGSQVALLDGVTALLAAGLRGYTEDVVHVSVVHRHRVPRRPGVRLHKIADRLDGEHAVGGPPRTRPSVAALRAARWARSDRQAATILLMAVQQGLCTPAQLAAAARVVRGRARRAFVRGVVVDITDGVRALGELDFARLCRERGLPEPVRQQVVDDGAGRIYLDVRWPCGLVVEIDGAHHLQGTNPVDDLLRQNEVVIDGDLVLRIPNIGLRLHEDAFLDQVERALARLAVEVNRLAA